jgi:hypothetical protein
MVQDHFVLREVGVQQHHKAETRRFDLNWKGEKCRRTTVHEQNAHKSWHAVLEGIGSMRVMNDYRARLTHSYLYV